jgi:hypothetical protein
LSKFVFLLHDSLLQSQAVDVASRRLHAIEELRNIQFTHSSVKALTNDKIPADLKRYYCCIAPSDGDADELSFFR